MTSIEILRLHAYLLEKFNIFSIPNCTIEAVKNSDYRYKFDILLEGIEANMKEIKELLLEKGISDDNLMSYAIVKYVVKNKPSKS